MHTKSRSLKVHPPDRQFVESLLSEARIASSCLAEATVRQSKASDEVREQKARHERVLQQLGELALGRSTEA